MASIPTVLLAEDSEDDAFFFGRALARIETPIRLLRKRNGLEVIEFLQECERAPKSLPLMLFLDLKMPLMDGFEVLKTLQVLKLPRRMKVYVLSGSNLDWDRSQALRLGACDYITKPVTTEMLQNRILAELNHADL